MVDPLKIEEIVKRKEEITIELNEIREKSLKSIEEVAKKELELKSIEDELDNLRSPSNSFLKAFSRVSDKATNVIRNVRLSIMSEDELKKEYQIYKRVNETLGKEFVNFDSFKETPEDFIEKNSKSTKFREIEDSIKETTTTLNSKVEEVVSGTEKSMEKFNKTIDESIQKAKPAITSFSSMLGKSFSHIGKQVQEIVKTTVDKYEEAKKEVDNEKSKSEDFNMPSTEQKVKVVEPLKVNNNEIPTFTSTTIIEQTKNVVKKAPAKKLLGKKDTAKMEAEKARIKECKSVLKQYIKMINKSTPEGTKPVYDFDDYTIHIQDTGVDKNFKLNKVSFTKAIKLINSANDKKIETKNSAEIVTPDVSKKSAKI